PRNDFKYTKIVSVDKMTANFATTESSGIVLTPAATPYGSFTFPLPAGTNTLYYLVHTQSQDGKTPGSYYLRLDRKDANVSMESVTAVYGENVSQTAVRHGDGFSLNIPEKQLVLTLNTKDWQQAQSGLVKVTGFNDLVLDPTSQSVSYVTTPYYSIPDTIPEGTEDEVPFLVTDTGFFVNEAITPLAFKRYTVNIFRSTHDAALKSVWVVDPADSTHRIEAVARPDNPTIYEVAIDTRSGNPIGTTAKPVNVEVNAANDFTTLTEIGASGGGWQTAGKPIMTNSHQAQIIIPGRSLAAAQTDVNFYAVSSSGRYQQYYTLRVYYDDKASYLGTDTVSSTETPNEPAGKGGVWVNSTAVTYDRSGTTPRFYHQVHSREAVNLTVRAYNPLATVVLRGADGDILSVLRGGGVFENVSVAKLGE
ncbi:MAG: hypothetical protein RSC08_07675, partial [Oscillospiraceae bacterium]